MRLARGDTVDQGTFNNNIRCIEIGWGIDKVKKHQGLITT